MNSNIPEKTDLRSVSCTNDEIDFIEIIGTIWRYRIIVVLFTIISLIGSYIYFSNKKPTPVLSKRPNFHFTAEASFYCPEHQVLKQTIGYAAQQYFKSTDLYQKVINKFDLYSAYEPSSPTPFTSIEKKLIYNLMLNVSFDFRSEVLQVRFHHKNEKIALGVIQLMVKEANDNIPKINPALAFNRLAEPSIVGGEEIVVFNPPQVTGLKKFVFFMTMLGLIFSIGIIFILNQIQKIRKDPVALRKLKGTSSL